MTNKNLKIVLWDVETSFMETRVFHMQRKYKNHIGYDQIKTHWYMICACWKELGSSKMESVSLLDDPKRFKKSHRDDYFVVKKLAESLRDVDILIAHNGDKFDLKMLNQRLIFHKLPPLPKILSVDTLKQARSIAEFPSNSLNNLGLFLGLGSKVNHSGLDMWIRVDNGEEKAIDKMVRYCKGDIKLLEKIYNTLRPYMKNHPNVADVNSKNCPKCNSHKVVKHKTRLSATGVRKQQYQCGGCGSYFTDRTQEKEKPQTVN